MQPAKHMPGRWRPALALCLSGMIWASCDNGLSSPEELSVTSFAGSWRAARFASISQADTTVEFDLVESGGTLYMAIQAQGSFAGTATIPGLYAGLPLVPSISFPLTGYLSLPDDGIMFLDFVPDIPPLFIHSTSFYTLRNDSLTLRDEGALFDFDQDGHSEPATMLGTFVRN